MYEYEYLPLFYILNIEVAIFILLVLTISIKRIINFFKDRASEKRIKNLNRKIVEFLSQKETASWEEVFSRRGKPRELLITLDAFDKTFKESGWEELKSNIVQRDLLALARKWSNSYFWKRRCFAARCFALHPRKEDETMIIHLIKDKKFLVLSHALRAAISIESETGVEQIISKMSTAFGYVYYFIRDCLQKSTDKVFQQIVRLAEKEELHVVCLDVLSKITLEGSFPSLKDDLNSPDLKVKKHAIDLLAHNPIEDTPTFLIDLTNDEDEIVRYKAVECLSNFMREDVFEKLEMILLSQDHWKIRLEAAIGLKKLGQSQRLENITNEEAAQFGKYAMEFGEEWIQKRL